MRNSPARFQNLIIGVVLIWFSLHAGMGLWFAGSVSSVSREIWKYLLADALLALACLTGIFVIIHCCLGRRAEWLADEATGMENGGMPGDTPPESGAISKLSSALRLTALRKRALRKAMDEHSIVDVTDRQGNITFVNDRFCGISGYSREELYGKSHRIISSGRHPEEFFRKMWATISSGGVWKGDIENLAKNGSRYVVATTITSSPGADGKPDQYIAIRTDVTDQKALVERLGFLSRELEAKNRDLEILINAASHDLRAPLVNVQGFASVIEEQLQPMRELLGHGAAGQGSPAAAAAEIVRETEEALFFIRAGAEKMEALLKGLLIFSRLGRECPVLRPVMTDRVVSESLAAIRFQIETAGAEVRVGSLPPCLADPGLFGQVVSNLIDNAIKYRDPVTPLQLSISGSEKNGECVYCFQDNGIGIPSQHHDRIFELFHRLDPHRKEGHGLGLAIVRRALDRMGGRVSVEPALEKGTLFKVFLAPVPGSADGERQR